MHDILTLYKDFKTELTKVCQVETYQLDQPRNSKDDPLTPVFSLITDALILVRSLYQELLNGDIDTETMFILDNIMSRIERTILFSYYFNYIP
ncbi:MAG: hypothetical protein RXO36_05135 [Candidatus Nanopusillus acidilobi]